MIRAGWLGVSTLRLTQLRAAKKSPAAPGEAAGVVGRRPLCGTPDEVSPEPLRDFLAFKT